MSTRTWPPRCSRSGVAVIVPDLRGHGQSKLPKGVRKDESLDAANMPPSQFRLMVTEDMKAIKDFLWERNNAGELNIDKLCVVGAEMGASVALDFAVFDAAGYGAGSPYYGPLKLGAFVKALVLISPEWSFRGLPLRDALASPAVQRDIAMLILVGKQDAKALEAAKRIYGVVEKYHPEPTGDDKLDKQTLLFGKLDTRTARHEAFGPEVQRCGLYHRLYQSSAHQKPGVAGVDLEARKFPHG